MSTHPKVFRNARLVLADEVKDGSLTVDGDGRIESIGTQTEVDGHDCGGDFLLPGLVELHTDHLETHYAPRPKVRWNPVAAVQAHDAQIACAGITTVFDALRVGMDEDADLRYPDMRILADALKPGKPSIGCAPTTSFTCAARCPPRTSWKPFRSLRTTTAFA